MRLRVTWLHATWQSKPATRTPSQLRRGGLLRLPHRQGRDEWDRADEGARVRLQYHQAASPNLGHPSRIKAVRRNSSPDQRSRASRGAVPVTSGQPRSALPETISTVGPYDLGPAGPPERPVKSSFGGRGAGPSAPLIAEDAEWQAAYVRSLLAAASRPPAELAAMRVRMKATARRVFSWDAVARQWAALF